MKLSEDYKKGRVRKLAAFLSLTLTVVLAMPVPAADTAPSVIDSSAQTVTRTNTSPTYNQQLARKVMVAMDIVGNSNITAKGLKKQVSRQVFAKMLVKLSPYKNKVGTTTSYAMYSDVKKNSAYAPYIKIAVNNGWMKGNLKGKFRPKEAITLQEAVNAVLSMLGYEDSDFQGNLASAKISFYKAQKLNKNIGVGKSSKLTYKEVINLLYNMLVTKQKTGGIYGQSLGYTLDANGDIDYLTLVYDKMDGPVIAGENWKKQIPFDVGSATIYIDGSKNKADQIKQYDVLYYSKKLKSIFVYQDRVTGRLNSVLPDRYTPTAVTVAGKEYQLANQDLAYELSALGSYEVGDYVTLLLGRDGKVVGIGNAVTLNSFIGGIVISKEEKLPDGKNDKNQVDKAEIKKYITMLDTLGEIHEYEVDDLKEFSENTPVEVAFDNGRPVVNKVSLNRLNGIVDYSAKHYAGLELSDSIRILEYDQSCMASIKRTRLAGITINATSVLYYHVNANKEITDMIVRNVTGDNYQYGLLTSASEISQGMMFSGTYAYRIGDTVGMATNNSRVFGMSGYVGPVQMSVSNGTMNDLRTLGQIDVTSITQTEVSNGRNAYTIADDVLVYLKKGSSYYTTTLARVMSLNNYELTAYYNGTTGGRVRVIIAEAK